MSKEARREGTRRIDKNQPTESFFSIKILLIFSNQTLTSLEFCVEILDGDIVVVGAVDISSVVGGGDFGFSS